MREKYESYFFSNHVLMNILIYSLTGHAIEEDSIHSLIDLQTE